MPLRSGVIRIVSGLDAVVALQSHIRLRSITAASRRGSAKRRDTGTVGPDRDVIRSSGLPSGSSLLIL
jgi:hypothetical protein